MGIVGAILWSILIWSSPLQQCWAVWDSPAQAWQTVCVLDIQPIPGRVVGPQGGPR